ncbi:hypothetical protein C2845_PM11G05430 [Panicum miliaceum]|uniref:Uncharacterized protein n=1 Tax=Panicum miliaceum TaxID=4540 RepID=A0A3L6RMG3_PANMI|nr:hypothetical protein C2845_PM11G05430 [Panicum miliaceum]
MVVRMVNLNRITYLTDKREEDCTRWEVVANAGSERETHENQPSDWSLQVERPAWAAMDRISDRVPKLKDLEPFFFDEADAVADHGRRMRREQEEACRKEQREQDLKVHNAAMDKIHEYEPKLGRTTFTRINFCNLGKFNLDEEFSLKEKLVVTIAARTGLKSTIKFTPRVNGRDEKMKLHVVPSRCV